MKLIRVAVLLAASVFLVGAVAACGDDDDDNSDNDGGTATSAAATTPATGGGGNQAQVEAKDFSFTPDEITVPVGEPVTVTLNNAGNATHTLTVYSDEAFTSPVEGADTDNVPSGDSGDFTVTFTGGEYYFRCEIHNQMQGELIAE